VPAINPRITITLTPQLHAVLRQLSSLTGNSQSSIVGDLLETSLPVFERMCTVLDAAHRLKEEGLKAPEAVKDSLARAQERLEQQLNLVLDTVDDGAKPLLEVAESVNRRRAGAGGTRRAGGSASARRAVTTPVPVTRGSGHPGEGKKSSVKGGKRGGV
jgi:hypothetical protein